MSTTLIHIRCEYGSPSKRSYWCTSSIGPRALSKDNPRHEVNLPPLLLGDSARKYRGHCACRESKISFISRRQVPADRMFDMHRTILYKYQETGKSLSSLFFVSTPSSTFVILLARRRVTLGCASKPYERPKSAGGRWMIRGCAGADVSTRVTLRATPSRFSAEPHCFIGKLVGSTRTRHR